MASIAPKNGTYHVRFRYAGRHFRRSLHTRDPRQAEVLLFAIRATLGRIELGQLVIPVGVDAGDFIASAGMKTTPTATHSTPSVPLLRTLIDEFHATRFTVARSTAYTERIHLKHFATGLGTKLDQPSDQITQRDLDRHLFDRSRNVAADTVAKERATIIQLFRWLVEQGYLARSPALKLAKVKGAADRAPFRTQAEIQAVIARGGLEDAEVEGLWRSLYLSPDEVAELLQLVTNRASQDFAPLLHAIPAFTGMRRGEVMRLRWADVDFDRGYIIARSRKQSRQSREVARHIDLHPELAKILQTWRKMRQKGQFVVCKRDTLVALEPNEANRAFRQPLLGTHWCLHRHERRFKLGFHTYRHSFASNLAAAGVDQRVIDEFMGHQTEAMRKRYRHLFPGNRRSAILALKIPTDKRGPSTIPPAT